MVYCVEQFQHNIIIRLKESILYVEDKIYTTSIAMQFDSQGTKLTRQNQVE